MKKYLLTLYSFSSILFATTYICEVDNTLAVIKTNGDYEISVNINGTSYDGVWKGSTSDEKGKPVKLHYLYGKDNIWIHSQNNFKNTSVRFHSDMDNMYIKHLSCRIK